MITLNKLKQTCLVLEFLVGRRHVPERLGIHARHDREVEHRCRNSDGSGCLLLNFFLITVFLIFCAHYDKSIHTKLLFTINIWCSKMITDRRQDEGSNLANVEEEHAEATSSLGWSHIHQEAYLWNCIQRCFHTASGNYSS